MGMRNLEHEKVQVSDVDEMENNPCILWDKGIVVNNQDIEKDIGKQGRKRIEEDQKKKKEKDQKQQNFVKQIIKVNKHED